MLIRQLIASLLLCSAADTLAEITVVSHNITADALAHDPGYEARLLILSLDKTRDEYGEYRIEAVRDDMNRHRRIEMMAQNRYKNFVSALPYAKTLESESNLSFANFPVFLGILGYRTCFTSDKIKDDIAKIEREEQLFQFTQGLQKDWADIAILRSNGFRVTEVASYGSLFKMVAANRIDLFCRGANEVLVEYQYNKDIPHFHYDRSMAIYYPLPHFFYMHNTDVEIRERIKKGLIKAHEDGDLQKLWESYNKESIAFVALEKRRVFHFKNPNLKGLPTEYEKYIYQPKRTEVIEAQ